MELRQKAAGRLRRMAQTLTKEAARANGNKRLLQVVGIVRIGVIGVDKDRQTVHLILLDEHIVAEQRIKDRIERQNEGPPGPRAGPGSTAPIRGVHRSYK